jgi:histidinol-phosphate phosphatase family protein
VTGRPAAFVDRDGTIIRDASYIRDPADVQLLEHAADAIRRLNDRGICVVVITNQSGFARGLLDETDYERVRTRVDEVLAAEGARIDATYMCPHHPAITGPCDCRKPGVSLYRLAIAEHGLDPSASLYTGDRWRDVAPAAELGGVGVLIDVATTPPEDRERALREGIGTAGSLMEAVDQFLAPLPRGERKQ